ncbi:MAG: Calvin cycle protein CP12 [Pseudanabaenaceae cyanobacterium SKYGB_i_bin29]|nr:Calvin cycle protein CP12 [Pseudanabaenaceae cyanobacterium SKYG29]MDW8420339.1 Calvin cycle protein CP12 [Pseudanabaenaceae cyanobacterium SKYGB_i_bin29]
MSDIHDRIQEELENARKVCETSGIGSKECAAAYDALEEVQAEAAHQREQPGKTSLERYCDENPDAVECRVYEE